MKGVADKIFSALAEVTFEKVLSVEGKEGELQSCWEQRGWYGWEKGRVKLESEGVGGYLPTRAEGTKSGMLHRAGSSSFSSCCQCCSTFSHFPISSQLHPASAPVTLSQTYPVPHYQLPFPSSISSLCPPCLVAIKANYAWIEGKFVFSDLKKSSLKPCTSKAETLHRRKLNYTSFFLFPHNLEIL